MFCSRLRNFAFHGLAAKFWLSRRPMGAIWRNPRQMRNHAIKMPGRCWRRLVRACWHGRSWLRCYLRPGVQLKEAHHVMSDREPQQMDAGLDLAAQA